MSESCTGSTAHPGATSAPSTITVPASAPIARICLLAARINRGRRRKRRSGGRTPLATICALSKRVRLFVAGAVVIAALFIVALVNTSAGTNVPVAVFPSDGSEAATAATQISFRGASKKDLTGISVTGSETGRHSGRLESHSDGEGASFLPAKPFKPGETVTVSADPDLVGAGGDGDVEFKIAETAPKNEAGLAPKINDPGGTPPGVQHFNSEPGLQPASIQVTRRDPGVDKGYLFLGIKAGPGQDGPMISDDRGRLVWFHRVPFHTSAFDFRTQLYRGRHVLTWWQGPVLAGEGFGEGIIYDDHYQPLATVQAGTGYQAELHEFTITRRNTALMIAYQPLKADLRSVGGRKTGSALDTDANEIYD